MKKRTLSILLVLVLLLTLVPIGAAAARVVVSRQNLRVDGKVIQCQKYNIDDRNYFMLRDLALLLNGTGSQFSVKWDTEKLCVSVVTGEEYVPDGSELDLTMGDQSASAVTGSQPIIIDGVLREDLTVYNIGDHNYFQLKELGPILGFGVNYDPSSNTAIVISKERSWPMKYLTEDYTYRSNDGDYSHSITTYDEDGRILSERYESDSGTQVYTYRYNELGRKVEETYRSDYTYEGEHSSYGSSATYDYNIWGLLEMKTEVEDGDYITTTVYTYNDQGRVVEEVRQTNAGTSTVTKEYDERGNLLKETSLDDWDDYGYTTEYAYDAENNCILTRGLSADGNVYYEDATVYENGRPVKETHTSDGGNYVSTTTYTYDGEGRLTRYVSESPYGRYETQYTYDKAGNTARIESLSGEERTVSTYVYDEQGNELRSETVYSDGSRSVAESTYNEDGDPLTRKWVNGSVVSEQVFTYDAAARKKTSLYTTTYPDVERVYFDQEGAILGVGDTCYLYLNREPGNGRTGKITWTSSDPAVAVVDAYGTVTALAAGEAKITAKTETGPEAVYTVTVAKKYTLTVDPATVTVKKGYSKSILCSVAVAGYGHTYKLNFSGGNDSVATLSWDGEWHADGNSIDLYVRAVGVGETTFSIFVTENNEYADELVELTVKVTE